MTPKTHSPIPELAPVPSTSPASLVTAPGSRGLTHRSRVGMQAVYQAVVAGLLAYYQPSDVFLMKSGTCTRDELVARFQAYVAAAEKTKSAYQAWRASLQEEQAIELSVRSLRSGVRGIAQARFGKDGAQVLQFGFVPFRPAERTAESKAAAVKRAKATREARGTRGRKQRLEITGETAQKPSSGVVRAGDA